ncbi:acyl-CoA dehydrogenase [Micrococcus sp. XM4230A]|uniref:acyl-CoA dehydrogenase n=1 Tax=Micrococcus TaxID=1269 RepID=UPI0010ADEF7E|nr:MULTISPECIES: acyl-CoA dehydrogenase [Micrococcus]MCK1799727.1 acyl-CoA dehydrogenase [Micrococcus sp. XM4230B]MCK1811344.1 acyl-CoA dehydrogenase [Micrococcus sp. XM4230A]TKD65729.1 acyl-CoA dehydrogenase [Micrococcus luteus]
MTTYATLAARYADAFDSVAHGERAREAGRHLPFAALGELQAAGFGKVGVPVDAGGEGGGSETVLRLLMDLAARDVNTAHVWRSHLVFIATAMDQAPARRERWLRHIVDGDWAGSALAERAGGAAPGRAATLASRDEGGTWVVRGQKYYATGSAFATWTAATVGIEGADLVSRRNSKRAGGAVREPDRAVAVVRVRQPRVGIKDDWDGFGQRLTATGSVVLDDAAAEELLEVPRQDGPVPVLMEATLLALQAGIGRAALTEGTQLLRQRRRTFNTGTAALPKDDPQLLEIMGQLAGRQAAAELMVREIGRLLDEGEDGADGAGPAEADVVAASAEAMAAAYRAQAVVPEAVLEVCTRIFDTLGASATSATLRLDRHWRNARTLATHDPAAFKVRMAGDWLVNGTPPTAYTSAGEVPEGD